MAQMNEYRAIEWVRTGIPAIDLVIGGGIPRGRMIEVIGEYSTAKSTFGYVAIGAFQRAGGQCILLDSELKTDKEFAEKQGADMSPGKLGYHKGRNLKEAIQVIGRVAQQADPSIPTLIVWDSIAACPGAEELDDHVLSDDPFTGEKASRARQLSASLRAVCNELTQKNVTLLAINQLRTTFNFMGKSGSESPGGKAGKYHAAVRLKMRNVGRIRHKERDVVVGVVIAVEAIKNACAPPFRKAEVKFRFDTGFDTYSGLDELLLRHGRIDQKGGWLTFRGKSFHGVDIERIVAELPDLIAPLGGVVEAPSNGAVTAAPMETAVESEETKVDA